MSEEKSPERPRYFSLFPKTLSKCIEPITRPILKTKGLAGSRILNEWPSIVGDTLSKHCIPQQLSFPPGKKTSGNLSIAVENGFATELQHQQPVILERLAIYFGYRAVTRITISHTYVPETEKTIKPYTPTTPLNSLTLTEHIEDDDLRAALTAIAKTLSRVTS